MGDYSRKSSGERKAKKRINELLMGSGSLRHNLSRDAIVIKLMGFGHASLKASRKDRRGVRHVDYEMVLPRNWLDMTREFELPLTGDVLVLDAERFYHQDGVQTLRVHYATYRSLNRKPVINDAIIRGFAVRLMDGAAWTFYCGDRVEPAIDHMYDKYKEAMGIKTDATT